MRASSSLASPLALSAHCGFFHPKSSFRSAPLLKHHGTACWCCLLVLLAGAACLCCLLVLLAGAACWCWWPVQVLLAGASTWLCVFIAGAYI